MWGYPPMFPFPYPTQGSSEKKERNPLREFMRFQKDFDTFLKWKEDEQKKKDDDKKKKDGPKPRVFSFLEVFCISSIVSLTIGPMSVYGVLHMLLGLKDALNAALK